MAKKQQSKEKDYLTVLKSTVKDYMRTDGYEVCESTTAISTAKETLRKKGVNLLIIRRGKQYVGVLTKDSLSSPKIKEIASYSLDLFSSKRIATITPEDNILKGLGLLYRSNLINIPVQTNNEIVGYLHRDDLTKVENAVWANFGSRLLLETDSDQNLETKSPEGPFVIADKREGCSLLIFVPEDFIGSTIDAYTSGYGYSHVAIDCCEVDEATGKRTMIEATSDGVNRAFQDKYGNRRFARIPLSGLDLDCHAFCECVKSKLGQPYDTPEAITKGGINDPDKQICSGLAAVCFPRKMQEDIAKRRKAGQLREGSVVVHGNGKGGDMFVSPNGLAEYFGAPLGPNIGLDETVNPPQVKPTPTVEPIPTPPSAKQCRVKVTLIRVEYNGDYIGNDWRYLVSVMGQKKEYNKIRKLKQNRSDNFNDVLYDRKLGYCGSKVNLDIYAEATEVDWFDDEGSNQARYIKQCPSQQIEELTVGVQEWSKTARMKFVFNVELFCD